MAVLAAFVVTAVFTAEASAMYNPTTGTFVQRDPIGNADGMNLYQYEQSNPVSLVDPYGLWNTDVHQTSTTRWAGEAAGNDEKRKCKTVFSHDQATAIGAADEAIDHGATAPTNDTSWHFRSRGSLAHEQQAMAAALDDAKNGRCADAIRHLGNSLHPLQDSFSHTAAHGAETPAEHAWTSFLSGLRLARNPDDAAAWPQDVAAAEAATKAKLAEFLSIPCNPCVQCEGNK
jgi:uncharacterized protein RhaS with RHS repeats